MNYPDPDHNPACHCRGNPVAAFWCRFGHMTECHFPYSCTQAGCSHLERYDFEPEQVEEYRDLARASMAEGAMPPYELDQNGNARVPDSLGAGLARDGGCCG